MRLICHLQGRTFLLLNWIFKAYLRVILKMTVADLTDARVAEWEQIPAAVFQHIVASLCRSGDYYSSRLMSMVCVCPSHSPD